MDPMYGQISKNCALPNGSKLKLPYNPKVFFVDIMRAKVKAIVEQAITPAKVFPTSCVKARYMQLLIIIYRLWKVLKRGKRGGRGGWWARECYME